MALKDLWNTSRGECEARTIQQIMSWAGSLRDGSTAATDFREYLDLIPASLLSRYCDQCLASPFQDSGLALQDLINQVGKRLGFDVEFGRYRGTQSSIGFDGIWKFPSGHCAVIEVKTTSARHTISWSAIHAIGLEVAQANPFIPKWARGSNSVTHRRLFDIGRYDPHFAKTRGDFRERHNAWAVNTGVVRNQNSHLLY
jgi:hypothetical protein